jgi:hypothetical protein
MTHEDETETALPLSDPVYQVLGNKRRRYVFYLLVRADEPMDIGTLAERIASLESDQPVEEITYDQRKSAYTGLHQNHLPLMEQAGIIRSEKQWDRIELTERGSEIGRLVTGKVGNPGTRTLLYVGVPAFGIGLSLGIWLSVVRVPPHTYVVEGAVTVLGLLAIGYVLTR